MTLKSKKLLRVAEKAAHYLSPTPTLSPHCALHFNHSDQLCCLNVRIWCITVQVHTCVHFQAICSLCLQCTFLYSSTTSEKLLLIHPSKSRISIKSVPSSQNRAAETLFYLVYYVCIYFFSGTGVWTQGLILGRHSTTWATLPALPCILLMTHLPPY
jgi:hypothetical protein